MVCIFGFSSLTDYPRQVQGLSAQHLLGGQDTGEPSDHQGGQQIIRQRLVELTDDWNMVFYPAAGVMPARMLLWNVFAAGDTLFDSAGRKDVQEWNGR